MRLAISIFACLPLLASQMPNPPHVACTNAELGWSGQRHRDPTASLSSEHMTEQGVFAKLAYAVQF